MKKKNIYREKILKIVEEKGIKTAKAAEIMGMAKTTFPKKKIESGRFRFNEKNLSDLVAYYKKNT